MYCPNCGETVPAEARFCGTCGYALPALEREAPEIATPTYPEARRRRLPRWVLGCGAGVALAGVILAIVFSALYLWLGLHHSNETATLAPAEETVAFVSLQPSLLQLPQLRNFENLERGAVAFAPLALLPGVAAMGEEVTPLVDELEVDVRQDVLPWIGREVSLIVLAEEEDFSESGIARSYSGTPLALAAAVRNEDAALAFLDTIVQQLEDELDFENGSYRNVDYRYAAAEDRPPLTLALNDGLLLMASDPETLERALDTRMDGADNLAGKEMFHEVLNALPANRLGFVYFDRDSLVALDVGSEEALEAIEGVGMAIRLHSDGLRWDYAVQSNPGLLRLEQQRWLRTSGEETQLVVETPAGTPFYLAGHDLMALWEMLEEDDTQSWARAFQEETGVDFYDNILAHLDGEYGLALSPTDDGLMGETADSPYELLFLAETTESRALEDSLEEIAQYFVREEGLVREEERVSGVEMIFLEEQGTSVLGYGLHENVLFATTSLDTMRMVARAGEAGLTEDERYLTVAGERPDRYLAFLYADVATLRRDLYRSEPDFEEELEEIDAYLQEIATVFLSVEPMTDGGLVEGSLIVTLEK